MRPPLPRSPQDQAWVTHSLSRSSGAEATPILSLPIQVQCVGFSVFPRRATGNASKHRTVALSRKPTSHSRLAWSRTDANRGRTPRCISSPIKPIASAFDQGPSECRARAHLTAKTSESGLISTRPSRIHRRPHVRLKHSKRPSLVDSVGNVLGPRWWRGPEKLRQRGCRRESTRLRTTRFGPLQYDLMALVDHRSRPPP